MALRFKSFKDIGLVFFVIVFFASGLYFYYRSGNYSDFLLKNSRVATGSAVLSWKMGNEDDLAGYKIYYGDKVRMSNCPKNSGYSNVLNVGTTTSFLISDLRVGETYYFSVTSYDDNGNESCFSEEVKKTINSGF